MGQSFGDDGSGVSLAHQRVELVSKGILTLVHHGLLHSYTHSGNRKHIEDDVSSANLSASSRWCVVVCWYLVLPVVAHKRVRVWPSTVPAITMRAVESWLELLTSEKRHVRCLITPLLHPVDPPNPDDMTRSEQLNAILRIVSALDGQTVWMDTGG